MLGAGYCVMEVSSHALALGRTDGCVFEAAAFTNLAQDHLDFHENMDAYFQAKLLLFTGARSGQAGGGQCRRRSVRRRSSEEHEGDGSSPSACPEVRMSVRRGTIGHGMSGLTFTVRTPRGSSPWNRRSWENTISITSLRRSASASVPGFHAEMIAAGIRQMKAVPGQDGKSG